MTKRRKWFIHSFCLDHILQLVCSRNCFFCCAMYRFDVWQLDTISPSFEAETFKELKCFNLKIILIGSWRETSTAFGITATLVLAAFPDKQTLKFSFHIFPDNNEWFLQRRNGTCLADHICFKEHTIYMYLKRTCTKCVRLHDAAHTSAEPRNNAVVALQVVQLQDKIRCAYQQAECPALLRSQFTCVQQADYQRNSTFEKASHKDKFQFLGDSKNVLCSQKGKGKAILLSEKYTKRSWDFLKHQTGFGSSTITTKHQFRPPWNDLPWHLYCPATSPLHWLLPLKVYPP